MAWDPINDLISYVSSMETASYQKAMNRLKQQQLELDKKQSYNSSLDQLIQLADAYEQTGLQIASAESQMESANEWFSRYQANYDYQMLQAQAGIDKYSSYFANYDQNRALTMNTMFQGNIGTLRQMQENLAQQQVLSAARGQEGATSRLLSQMQAQEIVNFAGTDQTLDAEGGLYGQQYQAQRTSLENEYNENKTAYDIAVMGKEELRKDLEAQYQTMQNNYGEGGIVEQAIASMKKAEKLYYNSFQDALAATIEQGHYAGQTYNDLGEMIDRYRDYLTVNDDQYAALKNSLLEKWKPIDFEIRSQTYSWETGGESQHGANEHSFDYYQIYDKATGQLATEDQVKNILRTYAGNLSEKEWYGKSNYWLSRGYSNSYGLSNKAIETIRKNSNYDKRKDYK